MLEAAAQARCDAAFIPGNQRLGRVRLVVMDMDSTLIAIECIDEIADMVGLKPQVAAITESAMRGEIEFAESLRRRVALLGGLDEVPCSAFTTSGCASARAPLMLAGLQRRGVKTLLVSGGFTFFTDRLKAGSDSTTRQSNTLEVVERQADWQGIGQHPRRAGKAGDAAEPYPRAIGLSKGQVVDHRRRRQRPADVRRGRRLGGAITPSPSCARRRRTRSNHSGLDGVLNLFG